LTIGLENKTAVFPFKLCILKFPQWNFAKQPTDNSKNAQTYDKQY